MSRFKVNDDGVQALQACSRSLKESVEELENASNRLKSELSGNSAGAGPHYDQIEEIADEISQVIRRIQDPVDGICENLEGLAATYEEIIESGLN